MLIEVHFGGALGGVYLIFIETMWLWYLIGKVG